VPAPAHARSVPTLIASLLVAGAACDRSQATPTDAGTNDGAAVYACTITAPTACPDPPPHYPDVQPIIQRACVPCHQGLPGGNWPLLQYSHVADWQDVIRAMLLDCSMPPPDAGVPMSDDERTAILTWIRCGTLE
jgi:hypothetical protein